MGSMTPPDRRRFLHTSSLATLSTFPLSGRAQEPDEAPESPPRRLKAAQIGTQHSHAAGKLSTLLDLNDLYEVVAIAEPDETHRNRAAQRAPYKDLPWRTVDALLADPEIAVVAVETAIDSLVSTAIRCLKAGKHIHLDKPASQSLAPCREMHALASQNALTIQMGYMLRYNPAFSFTFEAVKSGWLGEITEVHGHMGKRASPGLRAELARYPGGGLFELACHLIDAVVTLLGKPEEIHAIHRRTGEDAFLDNQLATFTYPKALATVGSNHNDPFGGPRRQFTVIGTEGSIEIRPLESPALRLSITKPHGDFDRGVHEVDLPPAEGRYHGEFRDLAKVVRGEKNLPGTPSTTWRCRRRSCAPADCR